MSHVCDPSCDSNWSRDGRLVIGFLIAAVVLIAFRLQAFALPLETDEANYAYIGSRLLDGDRLYSDIWDHQPFGIYVLTAAVIGVFGDAVHVFRWSAMVASLVSLAFLMAILRRICNLRAAIVGGMLFALVSTDPGTGGEGCNREIYMNALILGGWFFALGERRRGRSLVVAGLLLGAASTFKTVVAVHWVLLAVYLWFGAEGEDVVSRPSVTQRLGSIAQLAVGPIAIWALAAIYFFVTGRFTEFIDAVFLFNLGYAESGEPFWMRFVRFFTPIRHRFTFESAFPLWVMAALATVGVGASALRRSWAAPRFVLMIVLSGYLATCLPGRFWPHYYYLLIPPCVIVVAFASEALASSLTAPLGTVRGWKALLGWGLAFVGPFLVGVSQARHFLLQSDFGRTVKRYNSRDFWGRAQGINVASVTDPNDAIFVFGNDASIYYYSGRRCASRYTMITGLASGMPGAHERRKILLRELETAPPRLILVLFDELPFDEWKSFLQQHYGEPIGWDLHDSTREPIMFVLARKDQPTRSIDWDWDRSAVGGWDLNRPPLETRGAGR